MKARDFLMKVRAAPGMFASNKEAFCMTVLTALVMDDVTFEVPGHGSPSGNFLAKHVGHRGAAIVGCNDPFDDEWAHAVVDDALSLIGD